LRALQYNEQRAMCRTLYFRNLQTVPSDIFRVDVGSLGIVN